MHDYSLQFCCLGRMGPISGHTKHNTRVFSESTSKWEIHQSKCAHIRARSSELCVMVECAGADKALGA